MAAAEAVRTFDFTAIAESDRGPGHFARAATPGLWRSSFTADEQSRLQNVMGPTLASLGYS